MAKPFIWGISLGAMASNYLWSVRGREQTEQQLILLAEIQKQVLETGYKAKDIREILTDILKRQNEMDEMPNSVFAHAKLEPFLPQPDEI
ncbi:hypothetical protein L1049_002578 [Liquidambar formosana]|uniref:Uncharacterized protein n=1 Tax=Liquidambar formosana TaxID=63359 RepID=A0AAP0NFA0_LIQFO